MGRGDQQDSFVETFAPTVGVASVRVLAALACESDLFLGHVDITQAFIRAELEETIHMRMPRGCGVLSGTLVKLNKSLYGLRQASRQWFRHLKDCFLVLDFEQCLADPCVFRLMEGDAVVLTLVVHVDDVFVVGKQERCDRLALELSWCRERTWENWSGIRDAITRGWSHREAYDFPEAFYGRVSRHVWCKSQARQGCAVANRGTVVGLRP